MKTYKTYIRAILPLFVVLGLVGSAQAQDPTIEASAVIVEQINFSAGDNLTFGQITANTSTLVTLSPTDGATTGINTGASRGTFTLEGTAGTTDLSVSWIGDEVPLNGDGVSGTIYWKPTASFNGSALEKNATFTLTAAAESAGDIIYIGGTLYPNTGDPTSTFSAASPAVVAGTYKADFTLTLTGN